MPTCKKRVTVTYDLEDLKKLIAKDLGIDVDQVNWIKDKKRGESYMVSNFESNTRYHFDGIELEYKED
jgi:hypothetical protein